MADIAWADVVNHAAELSGVDGTVQTEILAYVNTVIQVALIDGEAGPKTKLVRIYLAAHMASASASASGGTGGPISSKKEGDVAITYAVPTTTSAASDSTPYGNMYLRLINTSAIKAPLLL